MMALETDGPWSTATWTVTIGGVPAAFTTTTATDAYSWMRDVAAWVPTAWSGKSLTWTWTRDTATGGALFSMTFSHSAQLVADTDAQTVMGFGNATATTHTATAPASGSWAPTIPIAVSAYQRLLDTGNVANSRAGIRPGVPGFAGYKPRIEALGSALDAARIAQALGEATGPRRGWVYQVHRSAWRNLAFGSFARSPDGTLAYRWQIEAAGEAL